MIVSTRQFIIWIPSLLMPGLILWLSTISQPVFHINYISFLDALPLPEALHRFMVGHYKIGHPLCYAILTVTTLLTLRGRYLLVIMMIFTLGLLLEGVQYFLPTRSAGLMDLGFNLVGVLAGAGIVLGLKALSDRCFILGSRSQ